MKSFFSPPFNRYCLSLITMIVVATSFGDSALAYETLPKGPYECGPQANPDELGCQVIEEMQTLAAHLGPYIKDEVYYNVSGAPVVFADDLEWWKNKTVANKDYTAAVDPATECKLSKNETSIYCSGSFLFKGSNFDPYVWVSLKLKSGRLAIDGFSSSRIQLETSLSTAPLSLEDFGERQMERFRPMEKLTGAEVSFQFDVTSFATDERGGPLDYNFIRRKAHGYKKILKVRNHNLGLSSRALLDTVKNDCGIDLQRQDFLFLGSFVDKWKGTFPGEISPYAAKHLAKRFRSVGEAKFSDEYRETFRCAMKRRMQTFLSCDFYFDGDQGTKDGQAGVWFHIPAKAALTIDGVEIKYGGNSTTFNFRGNDYGLEKVQCSTDIRSKTADRATNAYVPFFIELH